MSCMSFSQELFSWVTINVNHGLSCVNHRLPKHLKSVASFPRAGETLPPCIIAKRMTTCSAWNKSLLQTVRRRHWASGRKYFVPNGFVWPKLGGVKDVGLLLMPKSITTNSTSSSDRTTPPVLPVKSLHIRFLGDRSPWYHPASCSSQSAACSSEATYNIIIHSSQYDPQQ